MFVDQPSILCFIMVNQKPGTYRELILIQRTTFLAEKSCFIEEFQACGTALMGTQESDLQDDVASATMVCLFRFYVESQCIPLTRSCGLQHYSLSVERKMKSTVKTGIDSKSVMAMPHLRRSFCFVTSRCFVFIVVQEIPRLRCCGRNCPSRHGVINSVLDNVWNLSLLYRYDPHPTIFPH